MRKAPTMPLLTKEEIDRDNAYLRSPDPERIWLQARCEGGAGGDRCWCEDDPGPCDECGMKSVEYIRADLVAKLK